MSKLETLIPLTPDQEVEAARLEERVLAAIRDDVRLMARLLASKKDSELFGETEFGVRDIVHGIGAKAIEVTAQEREKKGGIRGC